MRGKPYRRTNKSNFGASSSNKAGNPFTINQSVENQLKYEPKRPSTVMKNLLMLVDRRLKVSVIAKEISFFFKSYILYIKVYRDGCLREVRPEGLIESILL